MADTDTIVTEIAAEEEAVKVVPASEGKKAQSSSEKLALATPETVSEVMEKLTEKLAKYPEEGDIVEGPVIGI